MKGFLWKVLFFIGILAGCGASVYFYKLNERCKNAEDDMFLASFAFGEDKFEEALKGNEMHLGFLDVIEKYPGTKACDLAKIYAGVCYINLEKYDEGIGILSNLNVKNKIFKSKILGLIGDAYTEKKEYNKAIEFFYKAIDVFESNIDNPVYLFKIILIYEEMGDFKSALKIAEEGVKKYQDSRMCEVFKTEKKRIKIL